MNKKLALLALPIVMLTASTATAAMKEKWGFTPYIGVDAEWRHLNFKKGSGDNLFKHDYPQGNVYAGVKINEYVGIEAGYEATTRKTRVSTLGPGDLVASAPITATVQYHSTSQIKGYHVNLMGFLPLSESHCLQLIGMVGTGRLEGQFTRTLISVNGVPPAPGTNRVSSFTQKRNVLRLGGGIQHMLNENWGVRAMVKWENTNKLNNIRDVNSRTSFLATRNSLIYSLGTFVAF